MHITTDCHLGEATPRGLESRYSYSYTYSHTINLDTYMNNHMLTALLRYRKRREKEKTVINKYNNNNNNSCLPKKQFQFYLNVKSGECTA